MDRKRSSDGEEYGASPVKIFKNADLFGKSGTPIQLTANFFKVLRQPEFDLTQYRVDFQPDVDVTATRKKIISQVREQLENRFIFDGSSLFLTRSFDRLDIETQYNGQPMVISIKKTGRVDSSNPTAFQIYNLIIRESMAELKLQNIRRDYYDAMAKIDVPNGKLELWPGYVTSIRAHDDDVLLSTEISHKFMRKETVLDITRAIMIEKPNAWRELLKKEIIGTTVLTEYTNKTYQIADIDFTMSPKSTFTPTASIEGDVTYMEYYKSRYNITIKDRDQFMLVSKARERDLRSGRDDLIYLVPELCRATGMTDKMRADFKLMQEISSSTRLNPEKRVKALERFNNRIQSTPGSVQVLKEWKMELDTQLVTIPGRELPPEIILFGNNQSVPANAKGEWMLRDGNEMYMPVPIERWLVLYPNTVAEDTKNFLDIMKKAARDMNCPMTVPKMIELCDDRQATYVNKILELAPMNPKSILVVFPSNRADRYSAVKRLALVDLGIPTQVIIKRSLNHKNASSIATKVIIQMNAKLGGMPWFVNLPLKGLMTVGFDVSHHPRDKSRSTGALVATMDLKKSAAFYSVTSSYRDGNEMNNGLAYQMEKALTIYKETCGALPEKIVFYRDGVGEGQIQYALKQEVEPLLSKLQRIYGENDHPKLAYIIVNKRTNTRMFKKVGNSYVNPKPGTVVDRQITLPERNDYFLVSQYSGQGTVAPTAYNIIHNNSGLDKDKLEILTYKFTHLYFNWSGTTRIPAVCQYAKKLAFFTLQSLQSPAHENLERSLYFL